MGMNEVRTLLTGRGLVESPRWHGDRLYFSDWSAGEVLSVDLDGRAEVVAQGRRLVRRRAEPAVRARRRGRYGPADRRTRPRGLRLHAWRARPDHPVHRRRHLAGHDRFRAGRARQRPRF
jgi:sugar lactone lactonase YvrE